MSNPVFIDCLENEWTLVAENVVTGKLWRAKTGIKYLHTYRETGEAAPTLRGEGLTIFVDNNQDFEDISASSNIDVYMYSVGGDGKVRVDL